MGDVILLIAASAVALLAAPIFALGLYQMLIGEVGGHSGGLVVSLAGGAAVAIALQTSRHALLRLRQRPKQDSSR